MKVRALVSFAGAITMGIGEEKEISDSIYPADDLLSAGYIEVIEEAASPEATTLKKPSRKKEK